MKTKILRFVYRISGLRFLVSVIGSFVLRYRLRVRMVPMSYKVFVWSLGVMFGGSAVFVSLSYDSILGGQAFIFEQVEALEVSEAVAVNSEPIAETLTATFTAYSAGDGYTPGMVMASGREVYAGAVACPRDMALGTVIEVEGIGRLTCADRMAQRLDGMFDVYMGSIGEALAFGKKSMRYSVVK